MNSEFLEAYLADELDDRARAQVEEALGRDSDLRDCFLHQVQIDLALRHLIPDWDENTNDSFESAVMARLESEGAGESHGFAKYFSPLA